ncbi:DUF6428 family protein [Pedobacter sp. SYSU D00535]|uniref:DUF6428 family protein n=1 Tax=Pedobacter sp. SYSU D00535 TaxID=2810308 RepID=UPI001A971716|nr:DUF6428 family protein [Pedobacter sp. SYSU D00535]
MNNPNAISWRLFKENLVQHSHLALQFQYAEGKWVKPSYHITEIKQALITSVDCGGVVNSWTEIVIQLWEPEQEKEGPAMKASKALSIIDLVEKALKLDEAAEVKIEFGNSKFETRQMYPGELLTVGEDLIVNLRPDAVQCKAIGRGGSCGTEADGEACCATPAEHPKPEIQNLAAAGCCTPGSGCC